MMIFTSNTDQYLSFIVFHLSSCEKNCEKKVVMVDVLIFYIYFLDLDKQHGLQKITKGFFICTFWIWINHINMNNIEDK